MRTDPGKNKLLPRPRLFFRCSRAALSGPFVVDKTQREEILTLRDKRPSELQNPRLPPRKKTKPSLIDNKHVRSASPNIVGSTIQKLGGRLHHFAEAWKSTGSTWAWKTVASGARFSFLTKPRLRKIKRLQRRSSPTVDAEVRHLIEKGAVRRLDNFTKAFVSPLFTVPKPNGTHRLIINLRKLNRFIDNKPFKMLRLQDAFDAIPKGSWGCKIDLKDAYLQVPLARDLQRYVAFCWKGDLYAFQTLCFGISCAPRLFTKLMKALVKVARERGISVLAYLDDLFVFAPSKELCNSKTAEMLNLLATHGWKINENKSCLTPSQKVTWLGLEWNLEQGTVAVPLDKKQEIFSLIKDILTTGVTSRRELETLQGKLNFYRYGVRIGRTLLHPVITWTNRHTKTRTRDSWVLVDRSLREALQPWLRDATFEESRLFTHLKVDGVVCCDSSNLGYGAVWKDSVLSGHWSDSILRLHINIKELMAVEQACLEWGHRWIGLNIQFLLDNATAVATLRKEGSCRTPALHQVWLRIQELAFRHNFSLSARWIRGTLNCEADLLSRNTPTPTEWTLDQNSFRKIHRRWGPFDVDLFATPTNAQLGTFVTPFPHPRAIETNALVINWALFDRIYAFPPPNLVPVLLPLLEQHRRRVTLVAPWWPNREWFLPLKEIFPIVSPLPLTSCIRRSKENSSTIQTASSSIFTFGTANIPLETRCVYNNCKQNRKTTRIVHNQTI